MDTLFISLINIIISPGASNSVPYKVADSNLTCIGFMQRSMKAVYFMPIVFLLRLIAMSVALLQTHYNLTHGWLFLIAQADIESETTCKRTLCLTQESSTLSLSLYWVGRLQERLSMSHSSLWIHWKLDYRFEYHICCAHTVINKPYFLCSPQSIFAIYHCNSYYRDRQTDGPIDRTERLTCACY